MGKQRQKFTATVLLSFAVVACNGSVGNVASGGTRDGSSSVQDAASGGCWCLLGTTVFATTLPDGAIFASSVPPQIDGLSTMYDLRDGSTQVLTMYPSPDGGSCPLYQEFQPQGGQVIVCIEPGDGSSGEERPAPVADAGDAGPDVCAADAGTTVGDQCTTIVTAFCQQAVGPCATGTTLAECIANDMPMCCTGGKCAALTATSACAVFACTTSIAGDDCTSLVANGLPTTCQGMPAAQ